MVSKRRARGEIHLIRAWDPEAHVSMPVGGDRSAGYNPLRDINHLLNQVLVHDTPPRALAAHMIPSETLPPLAPPSEPLGGGDGRKHPWHPAAPMQWYELAISSASLAPSCQSRSPRGDQSELARLWLRYRSRCTKRSPWPTGREQLDFCTGKEDSEELRCPGNHARVDAIGHLPICHRVLLRRAAQRTHPLALFRHILAPQAKKGIASSDLKELSLCLPFFLLAWRT